MPDKKIRNYYVDEAGDLTLFNKKGKIMLGKNGVSNIFMIGVVELSNPILVEEKLKDLRKNLLNDSRFKKIPSMQPSAKKTALLFHAKNDHREVRQEVFKKLTKIEAKVQIAIRRKVELVNYAKRLKEYKNEKLSEGKIYDSLVTFLFTNMLHQAEENRIIFARLGTSERRESLASALKTAKNKFNKKWGKDYNSSIIIDVKKSSDEIGLQVIDYYLWALQRLYEQKEDSFFMSLAQNYSLIVDLDDKRKREYGEWYSKKNPLTLEKIKPLVS